MEDRVTGIMDHTNEFTESGRSDDEIELEFDCGNSLFVSRNFLRYASPVFDAMFTNDWVEKTNNRVKLPGKIYEDFAEFLLCIHPRIMKPVEDSRVLQVAPIAEEYQVKPVIQQCKRGMDNVLENSVRKAKSSADSHFLYQSIHLETAFHVLTSAVQLNYDDLVEIGVKTIARFGHINYNKNQPERYSGGPSPDLKVGNETLGQIQQKCLTLFEQLPADIRCRILARRLLYWDNENMK